ncbi:DUF4810 domain-containing protein [Caballeronia humi]|uniref:Lipoprotein n=1 Tax=Caballeronia humi TaxID=326474 RepID=A0A158IUB0_9BURK|nr:DUF4810 domain-containing protein [Caballeronia humi]SAL60156.1 lipoprotein [Caballeronia humi]
MKAWKLAVVLTVAGMTAACAPQSKYAWGNYESSLYEHYKTPGDTTAFAEHLADTISKAETSGRKVPPGIYAEYGQVLLESGDSKQAAVFFEKEKATWPESTVFMTTMIRVASSAKEAKQ